MKYVLAHGIPTEEEYGLYTATVSMIFLMNATMSEMSLKVLFKELLIARLW